MYITVARYLLDDVVTWTAFVSKKAFDAFLDNWGENWEIIERDVDSQERAIEICQELTS